MSMCYDMMMDAMIASLLFRGLKQQFCVDIRALSVYGTRSEVWVQYCSAWGNTGCPDFSQGSVKLYLVLGCFTSPCAHELVVKIFEVGKAHHATPRAHVSRLNQFQDPTYRVLVVSFVGMRRQLMKSCMMSFQSPRFTSS